MKRFLFFFLVGRQSHMSGDDEWRPGTRGMQARDFIINGLRSSKERRRRRRERLFREKKVFAYKLISIVKGSKSLLKER